MTDPVDVAPTVGRDDLCGPYVCPFPALADYRAGDRWTCSRCGTTYRLTRPKPQRWWRNWSAPYGEWRLAPEGRVAIPLGEG